MRIDLRSEIVGDDGGVKVDEDTPESIDDKESRRSFFGGVSSSLPEVML